MSREQNKLRQHIDECLEEREHRECEPEDEYLDYYDDLDFFEWKEEDATQRAWEKEEDEWDDREIEEEKREREDYEDWLDWEVGEPSFAEFGGRVYPEGDVANAQNHLTGE